jgi:hypothetical protein
MVWIVVQRLITVVMRLTQFIGKVSHVVTVTSSLVPLTARGHIAT